jgi:hypothetical protein
MSKLVLSGDTSGSVTLDAPAVSGTTTLTLPTTSGTVITTGSTFAGTGPAFSAYLSLNQSVTSGTFTKVQFNTEEFDTNSNYDNATNYRFTPTVAGYYQVNAFIAGGASTALTRCICSIYKNGSEFKRGTDFVASAAVNGNSIASALISFNGSTDYVEIYGVISAGTALVTGGQTISFFQAAMVRSA